MATLDIRLGYKDAAWFSANPTLVLKEGQSVFLQQTGTYKLGDGTTQLISLSFLGGVGGYSGATTANYTLGVTDTIDCTGLSGEYIFNLTDIGTKTLNHITNFTNITKLTVIAPTGLTLTVNDLTISGGTEIKLVTGTLTISPLGFLELTKRGSIFYQTNSIDQYV